MCDFPSDPDLFQSCCAHALLALLGPLEMTHLRSAKCTKADLDQVTLPIRASEHSLDRQIPRSDLVVGFEPGDGIAIDDLPLIDHGGVAGNAEAEMHVLLGDQDAGA